MRIYDFTKVGRFINKMCLLGSIALFNYALLNKPAKATNEQIGMILGMGLIAFQLYVCADLNIGDKIIGTEQVK